jgi:PKD repeat protein
MLRISYEVIKAIDPDAYVCLSGIGFPSFVDAVLRNTDNPIDGSSVPGYEHKGGAYFDAIGYSSLPHFDGSTKYYDLGIGDFVYERHSDAAIGSISSSKANFETVLQDYGYDGNTFPEKQWYVSACNVPRKPLEDFLGGDEVQRNFIIKAYVESMRNDLMQFHVRAIAESVDYSSANDAFQVMGLYQKLENITPYNQTINNQGIAYKTTSDLLFCTAYDSDRTAALNLPDSIDGAAFVDGNGKYTYVLWAKTNIDQSETASAHYSFPASLNLLEVYKKEWNYSETGTNPIINTTNVSLTGAPVFLTEVVNPLLPPIAQFSADTLNGCPGLKVQFTDESLRATQWLWTFEGANIPSSTAQDPQVIFPEPGVYQVRLEASNAAGSHTAIYSNYIEIWEDPLAAFNYDIDAPFVQFTNTSIGATNYLWDFGDNSTAQNFNPQHFYFSNGTYDVRLIAFNDCGTDTLLQTIILDSAPQGNFIFNTEDECGPYDVQFQDQSISSPSVWSWSFPGGMPSTSDAANPSINYTLPGTYPATMIVTNEFGSDTVQQQIILSPELITNYSATFCSDESITINGTVYSVDNPSGTEVIAGGAYNGCDSVVVVQISDGSSASTIEASICSNDVFEIGDLSLSETGTYQWIMDNTLGCDSIITIELEVLDTSATYLSIEFCEGESVTIGNLNISESGIYSWTTQNYSGCDSTVNIHAEVYEITSSTIDPLICQGEIFTIGELSLSEAGLYSWTTDNYLGCDSIITINLSVEDIYFVEISDTILQGETYTVGTSTYNSTGVYIDTLQSVNNCDSIIQSNLFVDIIDGLISFENAIQLSYFPNPFNQSFTIQMNLSQRTMLGIDLYDTNGRRVAVLKTYDHLDAGSHAYNFDQTNLTQGVYWVRLQMETVMEVFRIVKVK